MGLTFVETKNAPTPGGHYTQGVVAGGLLFVSGQLPSSPDSGAAKLETIEAQTQQALQNVLAIVEAAGSSLQHIAKVNIYIADVAMWGAVNEVYKHFFGDHKPARAIIPTKTLHYGYLVEIDAVAEVTPK